MFGLINGDHVATEDEIKTYEKVQYLLTCTKTMSADDLAGSIVAILPLQKKETIIFLITELIRAYIDIKQDKQVILDMFIAFCDNYAIFRQQLSLFLGTPISDTRIKIFHFRILRYLFKNEVYNIDDINHIIAHYNPHLENQYVALVTFFAPELSVENGENFQKAFDIIEDFENLSPGFVKLSKQYLIGPMRAKNCSFTNRWSSTINVVENGFDEYYLGGQILSQNEKSIASKLEENPDLTVPAAVLFPEILFTMEPTVPLLAAYTGWRKVVSANLYRLTKQTDKYGHGLKFYSLAGGDISIIEMAKEMHTFRLKDQETIDPEPSFFKKEIEYTPPMIRRPLGPVGLNAAVPSTIKRDERQRTNANILSIPARFRRLEALKWCIDNLELQQIDLDKGLMTAAENNFITGMRCLIHAGADPKAKDETGKTALHYAAEHCALEAVKFLLMQPKVDINAMDVKRQTPLHSSAYAHNREIFDLLENIDGINLRIIDIYRNSAYDVYEETSKPPN